MYGVYYSITLINSIPKYFLNTMAFSSFQTLTYPLFFLLTPNTILR